MSHAKVTTKLAPQRVLGRAVLADGRQGPLIIADGDVSKRLKRKAARNHARWNAGLRPNRLGIWR